VQVWAAPELRTHANNTRGIEQEMRVERGLIVSADGVPLAANREQGPYFFRDYPDGEVVSPWMGYSSLRYGRAGLERAYNPELAGETDLLAVRNYLDLLMDRPRRGADLTLTIDSEMQRAAVRALGDRPGAVVALDPSTGAVLALTSSPRFDPNTIEDDWERLVADQGSPLVDRALNGLYPPGSVFKVVVAGAGLEEEAVRPDTGFVDEGTWLIDGYLVRNYDGHVYGQHDFTEALVKSVNTTFAKVGVDLGASTLARYAGSFGIGEGLPWRLGGSTGSFPPPGSMDDAHVAQASFGQGEVLVTPMEMALVTAGIANGGRIMEPYLVSDVRDYRRTVLERTEPKVWRTPVSAATAAEVSAMMVGVVQRGTGTAAAIPGVSVAGKSGTAEVEDGSPHAWFVAFAPADDPRIAVAVLVEHGGTGGSAAAPVARAVLEAGLR
jgi:peptidoglycan glycosyltransferase